MQERLSWCSYLFNWFIVSPVGATMINTSTDWSHSESYSSVNRCTIYKVEFTNLQIIEYVQVVLGKTEIAQSFTLCWFLSF